MEAQLSIQKRDTIVLSCILLDKISLNIYYLSLYY